MILKNVDRNLYKKFINYEFKITEIKTFMDKFPNVGVLRGGFLRLVEVDLYVALGNNQKYTGSVKGHLKGYRNLIQSQNSAKKLEAESLLELYKHREFEYNPDLDSLIMKIELLDNIKTNR